MRLPAISKFWIKFLTGPYCRNKDYMRVQSIDCNVYQCPVPEGMFGKQIGRTDGLTQ